MKAVSRYFDSIPKFQTLRSEDTDTLGTGKPVLGFEIVFKSVSLRYPSRTDVTVLDDFNLRIEVGQHIAFCGPSVRVKANILSLLQPYRDPILGSTSFDSQTFGRSLSFTAERECLSQAKTLLAWNVCLRALDSSLVTSGDLEKACSDANILEFV